MLKTLHSYLPISCICSYRLQLYSQIVKTKLLHKTRLGNPPSFQLVRINGQHRCSFLKRAWFFAGYTNVGKGFRGVPLWHTPLVANITFLFCRYLLPRRRRTHVYSSTPLTRFDDKDRSFHGNQNTVKSTPFTSPTKEKVLRSVGVSRQMAHQLRVSWFFKLLSIIYQSINARDIIFVDN